MDDPKAEGGVRATLGQRGSDPRQSDSRVPSLGTSIVNFLNFLPVVIYAHISKYTHRYIFFYRSSNVHTIYQLLLLKNAS